MQSRTWWVSSKQGPSQNAFVASVGTLMFPLRFSLYARLHRP
ncbi:unnamed protein product [Linum tenue]|uniref:Uncharacterized protein n=1 Tax=Linum tenue TaxID=586396 RepID=A0AAV0MIN8_9ROSI|nr:unnamed protein product [Linum tenue]